MNQPDNLGSFFRENRNLLKEYIETRMDIFRLQGIKMLSKSMGVLIWVIIAAFLGFLIMIFSGLVLGFWLSDLTKSHVKGFGFATLIMIALFVLLTVFRNVLFVNPIIKNIILRSQEDDRNDDND